MIMKITFFIIMHVLKSKENITCSHFRTVFFMYCRICLKLIVFLLRVDVVV